MTLPLLLVSLAAIFIVFVAYKKLTWQALMWLSAIFFLLGGLPILIDESTPLTNFVLKYGNLWTPDEGASSVLEGWYEYCVLSVFSGFAFFVCALVKRKRTPKIVDAPEVPEEPPTQRQIITKELQDEVEQTKTSLGEATQKAIADAEDAMPGSSATGPPAGGFEDSVLQRFTALADGFVTNTIQRLKAVVTSGLMKLDEINENVQAQSYVAFAEGQYNRNATQHDPERVKQIKHRRRDTQFQKNQFIGTLKLKPAEQLDWSERTTTRQLVAYMCFFAMAEFFVSWFFLKEEVGDQEALVLALIAAVLIPILAFFAGWSFRWMRRPLSGIKRFCATIGHLTCWIVAFIGLGALIAVRDAGAVEGFKLSSIGDIYLNILTKPADLVVLLVNILGMLVFYWKTLHKFEKFPNFDGVGKSAKKAEWEYTDLFDTNAGHVKKAIDEAKEKSDTNSADAAKLHSEILDARSALQNMCDTIRTVYVQHLNPVCADMINAYRKTNRARRVTDVNPAPSYFEDGVTLPDVTDPFSPAEDIRQFLSEHQEKIDSSDAVRAKIQEASAKWDGENQEVYVRLYEQFRKRIADMGTQ